MFHLFKMGQKRKQIKNEYHLTTCYMNNKIVLHIHDFLKENH